MREIGFDWKSQQCISAALTGSSDLSQGLPARIRRFLQQANQLDNIRSQQDIEPVSIPDCRQYCFNSCDTLVFRHSQGERRQSKVLTRNCASMCVSQSVPKLWGEREHNTSDNNNNNTTTTLLLMQKHQTTPAEHK